MPIHRLVITAVILAEADTLAEVVETYGNMSLQDIGDAIESGSDIGNGPTITESRTLDPVEVAAELLAVGNDGTFFSSGEDDE